MKLLESIEAQRGLYTLKEAALFARIHPATLNRWIYGTSNFRALREPQIPVQNGAKFITFVEFVEVLAISSLRSNYNISLQKIREALQEARKSHEVDYPFASKDHKTYRCGMDLYIAFKDDQPIGLTGKEKRQKTFKPCLEAYMNDLSFDDSGMANKYIAFRDGDSEVQMSPSLLFGVPVIPGCGYSVETLWNAARAEGSIQKAAEFYEVSANVIHTCCRYWDSLPKAA